MLTIENEVKKSMMIQKVINYDWDEKWGFRNYNNNWWKAKEKNNIKRVTILSVHNPKRRRRPTPRLKYTQ